MALDKAKQKKLAELAAAEGIEPCCPLEVLDESYRHLNRILKWLIKCVEAIALAKGVTLPEKPELGAQVMLSKTAGWGNGNKT